MTKHIGFIGYGLRSRTMMKAFDAIEADICVSALADPRAEQIRAETAHDARFADTISVENADALLRLGGLDGVFVGTRCSLHADLAAKVLDSGIPLYLEKPVCINETQYESLKAAATGRPTVRWSRSRSGFLRSCGR